MELLDCRYDFWFKLDQLVAASNLKIERPKGTSHPRYPSLVYPLDYGYLQDTRSGDGSDIDVWIGSLSSQTVTAVICGVALEKRDTEIKILLFWVVHLRKIKSSWVSTIQALNQQYYWFASKLHF